MTCSLENRRDTEEHEWEGKKNGVVLVWFGCERKTRTGSHSPFEIGFTLGLLVCAIWVQFFFL